LEEGLEEETVGETLITIQEEPEDRVAEVHSYNLQT
jgi:hypothetical protein